MKHLVAVVVAVVAASCGGDDRPSADEWAAEWEREQALIPSAADLLDGGRELCDDLLGEYRGAMDRLRPTPSPELDDAVQAWSDDAESLVFDCPTTPDDVAARLADLDTLAAEIDAGLDNEPD